MSQMINPTCMSLADLLTGAPDPKRATAVLNAWYAKMVDVDPSEIKTLIIDVNAVFPVFFKDTLETLIERYAKMYAIEAKATMEIIADVKKDNPDGMSGSGQLKAIMSMPRMLKAAICAMYGDSWFQDKKNLRQLATLMPKFFMCNTEGI